MRLLEAIIEANHRAVAGDANAGLHPTEFADQLPLAALTCIDARLNALVPGVLGVPEDQFVWLRNAGNVITSSLSSTTRSIVLACAVKGAKEIAVIGHTDCLIGKITTLDLLERLKALGIDRHVLPQNLTEYFGMFASERQNVMKSVDYLRNSPLIGPKIPVHGLVCDINTGRLEWLVNGYNSLGAPVSKWNEVAAAAQNTFDAFKNAAQFTIGELQLPVPEGKIGEIVSEAERWASDRLKKALDQKSEAPFTPPSSGSSPPKIPLPPPLKPRVNLRRNIK
jgi:carbonic anhydrase